ncbi:MAG: repeat protein [Pedosphaera sp.]|nr:repeat protein [Pedosphaera sp.]
MNDWRKYCRVCLALWAMLLLLPSTPALADFASSTNFTLTNGNNSFTAIAADSAGRHDTNTVTVNLPASVGYTYDLNGNLLGDGLRAFDYDDENEPIRVTVANAWKSEFTYDGSLRMRVRKEFTWLSSAWVQTNEVHYVYDGSVVIQERDANNLPLITYTRGKDVSGSLQGAGGIGGLLSRTDMGSQQTAFYHADGNGNITALINAQQFPVARYLYDPFGNILSLSGPLAEANLYRFSSKEYYQNSGLLYYLYRFYDPLLQRWLNKDPIAEKGGMNLYSYLSNDPIDKVDLYGLDIFALNPNGYWSGIGSVQNNTSITYQGGASQGQHGDNQPVAIPPGHSSSLYTSRVVRVGKY